MTTCPNTILRLPNTRSLLHIQTSRFPRSPSPTLTRLSDLKLHMNIQGSIRQRWLASAYKCGYMLSKSSSYHLALRDKYPARGFRIHTHLVNVEVRKISRREDADASKVSNPPDLPCAFHDVNNTRRPLSIRYSSLCKCKAQQWNVKVPPVKEPIKALRLGSRNQGNRSESSVKIWFLVDCWLGLFMRVPTSVNLTDF